MELWYLCKYTIFATSAHFAIVLSGSISQREQFLDLLTYYSLWDMLPERII